MKYDFTRCDNLQFKAEVKGVERKGYLKVLNKENVYMFYSDGEKAFDTSLQFEYVLCNNSFANMMDFNLWAENHDLEIIPRDPETYTDWKVGDRVFTKIAGEYYKIAAKLGDIVFLLDNDGDNTAISCTAQLTKYFTLVLTDYEKELIHAQELEKKKECPFKNGDRVLVRDSDTSWRFEVFLNYKENTRYPYECISTKFEQCIPLNEHTWKLLGTTDEYKEEE